MSSTLHVQRVVVFLYAGSRRLLHNLTDMGQKALACLDPCVAMVLELYHQFGMGGWEWVFTTSVPLATHI
jgi:hypothetical protein